MAPVLLSVVLSNPSALLAWVCTCVPHGILLSLLLFAVTVILLLAVLLVYGLCRAIGYVWGLCVGSRARNSVREAPHRSQSNRVTPKLSPRHSMVSARSSLPRCPHCSREIHPSSSRALDLPVKPRVYIPLAEPRDKPCSPHRRLSDTTCDHPRETPTSALVPEVEQPITTPPRRVEPLAKAPARRSPRPRKPRKFSF